MEAFGRGSVIHEAPGPRDLNQFGNSSGDTVFDATQYSFFGNDVSEEVELGGLEEEDESLLPTGLEEEEFLYDKDEGSVLRSMSEIDDLAGAFSKIVPGSRTTGVVGDSVSRDSSSAAEWAQREEFLNWNQIPDPDGIPEAKRWSSQPFHSGARPQELHRTSSYPEPQPPPQHHQPQHHHPHFSSEPIPVPKSSFTSYPPPGGVSQHTPPYHGGLSSPNLSPFANSQLQMATGSPHGPHFAGNLPQRNPNLPGIHNNNNRVPGQWFPGDHPGMLNGMVPPQHRMPHHHPNHNQAHPGGFNNLPGIQPQPQPQHFNPHMSQSPPMLGIGDLRDQRPKSAQRFRPNPRFEMNNPWPQMRSKYMSSEEIDGIQRMQLAATHSNDPYVDDYYHQASLSKKSAGAKLRHHFCPTHLRELHPRARTNTEPHAFLQVDALGRIPFSSIRRPRPLLEVDPPGSSGPGSGSSDESSPHKQGFVKPLEQEPMLAARVAVEDGLCLLLEVDDIDRFMKFNSLPDSAGVQLRHRRRVLLEDLAGSLHLVDPLGGNGQTGGLVPKDDLVFMRIASLPKGRKLLSRFLQQIFSGGEGASGELMRIVCMAIFRHLRFLFGTVPADPRAVETTKNLAGTVSLCVREMDLKSLSACLAAVVCSPEQPPLRPLGSSPGDGASLILKSVLERATELLTDPRASSNYDVANRALWQASFDEFFGLLIRYCVNKYDSVMKNLVVAGEEEAVRSIGGEMPVELLRASLPHTDDRQRQLLLDFTRRSMSVGSD